MSNVETLAKIIWEYHHLNQTLQKADCILVLGNYDKYLAKRATDLYNQGYAPIVIFTGNTGKVNSEFIDKPEANILAEQGEKLGIPKEKILIENKSTNTKENIQFALNLIKEKGLNINTFLVVSVPCMERRAFATFKAVWPEKSFTITSPLVDFETDINENFLPPALIINLVVGYLQRIKVYGENGFQIPQEIPENVWSAYESLVELGYDKHLIETVEK